MGGSPLAMQKHKRIGHHVSDALNLLFIDYECAMIRFISKNPPPASNGIS